MNSNVLPFDLTRRGGMARRGAPDKLETFRCPTCAGELRLDVDRIEGSAEIFCERCETEIPLGMKTG